MQPVVETLTSAMDVPLSWDLTAQDAGRFSGAYTGQSGLPLEPDRLRYLTGSALESCTARDLEGKPPVRLGKRPRGETPMNFSSLAPPPFRFWKIRRPYRTGSWWCSGTPSGSSLAPLLAGSYRKITLIDLRYISSDLLESYVRFQEQDVLFLYSALIWEPERDHPMNALMAPGRGRKFHYFSFFFPEFGAIMGTSLWQRMVFHGTNSI